MPAGLVNRDRVGTETTRHGNNLGQLDIFAVLR